MRRFFAATVVALAILGMPALADEVDNGFYVGASVGQAMIEVDTLGSTFDGDDTGWKAIVGWRIINYLAVEANWIDFGAPEDEQSGTTLEVDTDGLDLAAMGIFPVGKKFEFFGKIGYLAWDATVDDQNNATIDANDDGEDLFFGAGAQLILGRGFRIRAEYEDFDIEDVENAAMYSLGATFTF